MKPGALLSVSPAFRRAALTMACPMLAMSPATVAFGQEFTFGPPVHYSVPSSVDALAIGDVNGDRLDDLVTFARPGPGQQEEQLLSVYIQRPDGILATPYSVYVGEKASIYTVGMGDFNEDGLNDIAVGMGYGITMLLADGKGRFISDQYVDGHVSTIQHIADINEDGHLDILSTTGPSVMLGDGHGSFSGRTFLPDDFEANALAYGDVSGDGKADIVGISPFVLSVAKGEGAGLFDSRITYDAPANTWNGSVAIGNFGGDSRNEVAIGQQNTYTEPFGTLIYSQNSSGDLLTPIVLDAKPFGLAVSSIARDFDGDGLEDLVVAYNGGMGLYLQGPTGLPQHPSLFEVDFQWADAGFANGDLDDDGCQDVALADFTVSVLRGLNCVRGKVHSDFDGDGIADLLWHNQATGASEIWKSADSATVQAVTRLNSTDWRIAATGDFDGDGKADVVWHNAFTGAGTIWKSGNYATQQALTRITDPAWAIVGAGDFDGDGKSDLLWRNTVTGSNAIWKSGSYHTQMAVTGVTDVQWKVAGVGDFDGDGKSDLLWRHGITGVNAIWKAANYRNQRSITAITNVAWQVAGIGDFDGDRIDDVFWRQGGANTIWRSAVYAQQLSIPAQPTRWTMAAVADYDGNGKADIVWRNGIDGSNLIWRSAASTVTRNISGVTSHDWVIQQ